jgi:hypothetical protein
MDDDGKTSSLRQVQCGRDDRETLTLEHLTTYDKVLCHGFGSLAQLLHGILDLLVESSDARPWVQQYRHLPFAKLLRRISPPPASAECILRYEYHLTYIMCGAFSKAEASTAIKTLTFSNKDEGHTMYDAATSTALRRSSRSLLPQPQTRTTLFPLICLTSLLLQLCFVTSLLSLCNTFFIHHASLSLSMCD